jgi:hypothetical protein
MNKHNKFSLLTAAAGAANTKKENPSPPPVVLSFAVIRIREFQFLFNRNSHIQLKFLFNLFGQIKGWGFSRVIYRIPKLMVYAGNWSFY